MHRARDQKNPPSSRNSQEPAQLTWLTVMPNDGELVDLIPLFAPDPVQQRKLLVDNPARLYKF